MNKRNLGGIIAFALALVLILSATGTVSLLGAAPNLRPTSLEPPALDSSPQPSDNDASAWGQITIAQPKIWQYERVNSLLDGLLRDVEGVSVADLTALDPNAANGAAVKFVQSMLEIGVKYDQAAAVTNSIALQNYRTMQPLAAGQVEANSQFLQQLYTQRQQVTQQLLQAQLQQSNLQAQEAAASGDSLTELQTQATAAASAVSGFQQELVTINGQITSASAAPPALAPPSVTSTSANAAPESANTFSQFLTGLPTGVQQSLNSQLQSPTLPATKRMDNFITLLYERLSRQISALQDDLVRDPTNLAYLVQFDVSLYPSQKSKNHVGVVEFTLNCPECRVYSVYPSQSSYNMANYDGASKRLQFWASFATLFGLGVSADYRRQQDTLHGDLVQSVYMSGFQSATKFGWYYGTAPFEQLVSPGVRSTFAIITVPRSYVTDKNKSACAADENKCTCVADGIESTSVTDKNRSALAADKKKHVCPAAKDKLDFTADGDRLLSIGTHAYWVPRNQPNDKSNAKLPDGDTLSVTLPGTETALLPTVVMRERDRLHVLGLEYNPVYASDPPASPAAVPTITVPATAATPPVTPPAIGDAAKQTAAPPVPPPAAAPPLTPISGCAKDQCSSVLLKLAEPIDANLVVTVRGEPLLRVRDWRGRATSILPPVQSESDFPPSGASATSGSQSRYENVTSRSLLESDLLAPNTWLQVDSHRLLLKISHDLAGEEDFPPIQIIAPGKHALFVPIDLDKGYSEIVTNGYHLPARDGDQLARFACLHFADPENCSPIPAELDFRPSGPYPYNTFLPLFLPDPPARQLEAYLGETGVQILISADANSPRLQQESISGKSLWLASHDQVILEDKDLDLAWSLSCYPQDPYLVCDIPQQEIYKAYKIFQEFGNAENSRTVIPRKGDNSVDSLQVWVEQYDPEANNAFRSAVPARLGRFPLRAMPKESSNNCICNCTDKCAEKCVDKLSEGCGAKCTENCKDKCTGECADNSSLPDRGFSPWHFERADEDYFWVTGCNYPDKYFKPNLKMYIFGQHIPQSNRTSALSPFGTACLSFRIRNEALTHNELVFTYDIEGQFSPANSLSTASFRPRFGDPVVAAVAPAKPTGKTSNPDPQSLPRIESWTINIPAAHIDCGDTFDSVDIKALSNPDWQANGKSETASCCRNCLIDHSAWNEASKNGWINLHLKIERKELSQLAALKVVHIIRNGERQVAVGRLPDNIASLILPTKLSATLLGTSQIALRGEHAELIDQVYLGGPSAPSAPIKVSTAGKNYALVTIQQDRPKLTVTKNAPASAAPGEAFVIVGTGFGEKKGTVTLGNQKLTASCWTDVNIGIVIPVKANPGMMNFAVSSSTGSQIIKGNPKFSVSGAPQENQKPSCDSAAAPALAPGTYTISPILLLDVAEPEQNSFPLEVTDLQGQPLTITVPPTKADVTKNSDAATSDGPTTTITISKKTTPAPKAPATATPTTTNPPAVKPQKPQGTGGIPK